MNKKFLRFCLLTLATFILSSCNDEFGLNEIKGNGLTYHEYFKEIDELDRRTDVTYYKPLEIDDIIKHSPESIRKIQQNFNETNWPFQVNKKEGYLISGKNSEGKINNQIQLSFFNISEYDKVEEFIVVSISELDTNPLTAFHLENDFDFVGNKIKRFELKDDMPIYQQILSSGKAMSYKYYDYNQSNNEIVINYTAANELYTYYEGYVYHIGYLINNSVDDKNLMHNQILKLVKGNILN